MKVFFAALLALSVTSGPAAAADPDPGYIFPGAGLHIQAWLPAAP